jgi:hypothetical protein
MKPQQIVEKARTLPVKVRRAAEGRWRIVHGEILDRADAVPAKQKLKNFEVHHVIEAARAAFLAELLAGNNLDQCRTAALAVANFERKA